MQVKKDDFTGKRLVILLSLVGLKSIDAKSEWESRKIAFVRLFVRGGKWIQFATEVLLGSWEHGWDYRDYRVVRPLLKNSRGMGPESLLALLKQFKKDPIILRKKRTLKRLAVQAS